MSTLAIFDELVNAGFETDILETRENIIIKIAQGHIKSLVLARKNELEKLRFEIISFKEMYTTTINLLATNLREILDDMNLVISFEYNKAPHIAHRDRCLATLEANNSHIRHHLRLNLRKLCENFQVILNNFKTLESEFPQNIFLWKNIRELYNFETISPDTELLLPDDFVDNMKQLDIKYENLKKKFHDEIFENYLHPLKFPYHHVFTNFDKVINVLPKSSELVFDN